MKDWKYLALILLANILFFNYSASADLIVLESDTIYNLEKIQKNFSKVKVNIKKNRPLARQLNENPSITVYSQGSGRNFEIVVNGARGIRHGYFFNGFNLNCEVYSGFDLSLIENPLISSVTINSATVSTRPGYDIKLETSPLTNGEFTFRSESLYNAKLSLALPITESLSVGLLWAENDNWSRHFDNNNTFYNYNDDFYVHRGDISARNLSFAIDYTPPGIMPENSDVFLNTKSFLNAFYSYRDIPAASHTVSPANFTNRGVLAGFLINPILLSATSFKTGLYAHYMNSIQHDTASISSINANYGINSVIETDNVKFIVPLKASRSFGASSITMSSNVSYQKHQSNENLSLRQLVSFGRLRIEPSLLFEQKIGNFLFKINPYSIIHSDELTDSYVRLIQREEENYLNRSVYHGAIISLDFSNYPYNAGVSVGRSLRIPSLTEIFGDNAFMIANTALTPEISPIRAEVYAGSNTRVGTFTLQAGFSKTEDLITMERTGWGLIRFNNTDEVFAYWATVSHKIETRLFSNRVSYGHYVWKNRSGRAVYNNLIPYIHPQVFKNNLDLHINRYLTLNAAIIYYSQTYTNRYNRVFDYPRGRNYLNIYGDYGFLPRHEKIDIGIFMLKNYILLGVGVANVTDNRVAVHPAYPEIGRNFFSSVTMKF